MCVLSLLPIGSLSELLLGAPGIQSPVKVEDSEWNSLVDDLMERVVD